MRLKLLKTGSVLDPIIQTGPHKSTALLFRCPFLAAGREKTGLNGEDAFHAAFWQNGKRNIR